MWSEKLRLFDQEAQPRFGANEFLWPRSKQEVKHKMKPLLAVSIVLLQHHNTAADALLLIQRLSTTTMLISIRIKTFQNHLSSLILWLSVTFGRIRCIGDVYAYSKTLQNRTLWLVFFFSFKKKFWFLLWREERKWHISMSTHEMASLRHKQLYSAGSSINSLLVFLEKAAQRPSEKAQNHHRSLFP